jgi:hypothetical protein
MEEEKWKNRISKWKELVMVKMDEKEKGEKQMLEEELE